MQSDLIYNEELLEGRNAMVTGGATGLGRAIAVGLAQVGAKVTIVSRQEDVLSEAVKQISDQTRKKVSYDIVDIRDVESVQRLQVPLPQGRPWPVCLARSR